MGPFYVVFHLLGVPVWVAQRLWLGSILFVAGAGIIYLCRVLGLDGPGPVAAALAYMLSPYFLQYAGRISVILLPWSGLPFLVGLTIVALRRGGWREPALFALVVACVSGINATSIIYVGVAPLLWILYAVVVLRETTWRHAGATAARIGDPHPRRVRVVDGRARGGGRLRRERPQVHRDGPIDVCHLQRVRGLPRPRVLVLLRQRPPGRVDERGRPLHAGRRADRHLLRRPAPRPRRGRLRPLARTGLLPRPPLRGTGARRRPIPLHRPHPSRRSPAVLHDEHDGRSGPTVDRPGGARRPAGAVHAAGRRPERALAASLVGRAHDGPPRRRPRRRQQPLDLQRRHHRQQLHPAGVPPRLPDGSHRPPQRHPPGDPGAGHPGERLRLLPLGRHRRHAPAGPLEPRLRDAGAADHGLHRHRRHALRPRRTHAGRNRQLQRSGPDGPAHGRGRRDGRVRPALRALRRAPAPAARVGAHADTPGVDRPGVVRHAAAQRADGVHAQRAGPGRARQPAVAGAHRRLHRGQPEASGPG